MLRELAVQLGADVYAQVAGAGPFDERFRDVPEVDVRVLGDLAHDVPALVGGQFADGPDGACL